MNYRKYWVMITILLGYTWITPGIAQKHFAAGDSVIRGNRLISVKSEAGKQLYHPERKANQYPITVDGIMSEPVWKNTPVLTPFSNGEGRIDPTSVRVLYDSDFIYLVWEISEEREITANMKKIDSVITNDDYVQLDLKPWIPDSIKYARDYYYTIAVNAKGVLWDAYYDPYLDGFFFSSWNSNAEVAVTQNGNFWTLEIIIPFSGLDVYSDPGWKWELEFRHVSNINPGVKQIYESNLGVTVQQDIQVRRPALVSYYWPRPDFMQEVKPDLKAKQDRTLQVVQLNSVPLLNSREDSDLWTSAPIAEISHTDKMGAKLIANKARTRVGMRENYLCINLQADGAKIAKAGGSGLVLGEGMAGQMAGVNGVFVDQALFEKECFWIILQPQKKAADFIHQDYYMIIVDNYGSIRGTLYDQYGAPSRSWIPKAAIDVYDTKNGWGAEILLDLTSFDIPVSYENNWGFNVFRNRLLEGNGYELQAWRYTGNDFLNPVTFGRLENIPGGLEKIVRAGIQRRIDEVQKQLKDLPKNYNQKIQKLSQQIDLISLETQADLNRVEELLQDVNNTIGTIDAAEYYRSVPHPVEGGYPLMDVQFIGKYGWAVGPMGTILRSENGGETWERISISSDADLYRVDFVDQQYGWVVGGRLRMAEKNESMRHDKRGGYGYIYATRDGGKTWNCQYGERGRFLFGLDFTDKSTGYACGERGILLKTTDGGNQWKELPTTGTLNWLYGMIFKDKENGFAVGLNETVIKTTNGGLSWIKLEVPSDRQFYGFRPIYRDITFNEDTGCIVGQNGAVLISHDGGDSWSPAATFFKPEIRDLLDLRSVQFVTQRTGYAVGEMGARMMVTEDGGSSWSYRPISDTEWLRAVYADSDGKIVIVGEREKVNISTDKGNTWKITHGKHPKADIMVLMAHGDDAALNLNPFFAHYTINQNKTIVDVGVMSDTHSSEYEETYNLEHDRNMWMVGVRTATNFNEFETGNNGCDYYHFTERLWEGEENVIRQMVAAIRAYQPDIVITHDGVYGDYDKPGHKLSGRAGIPAFDTAGGETDMWPELTRLGLKPWQPKKLYHLASESYPATLDLSSIANQPLKGTNGTCLGYAEYAIRNFQSQGVYHARIGKLCLVKSLVEVPQQETSVFDGLQ
jgi:photosystem II stability/assembly factor-like uncharacterized protein